MGASAGGLEAFTELLANLPTDTGMGFVLVPHLDPQHESALPHLLSNATALPVHHATGALRVEPNHVYILPPGGSLSISGGVLRLEPRERTRRPNRLIDVFFESLAKDQQHRAIGVVLSGTATDGTLGLEEIKAEGGITFAQDDSAKYDSMPRSAVAAGCVDFVLPPAAIAMELARIAKHPLVSRPEVDGPRSPATDPSADDEAPTETARQDGDAPRPSGSDGPTAINGREGAPAGQSAYKTILLQLRHHSGVDFSLYRSTTIERRITRRMVLRKLDRLDDYARLLRTDAKELDALYSDVLISVTSFFRNPETFEALEQRVLPELLTRPGDDPIRCWVIGCSTGQEAYSIAMSFLDVAERTGRARQLQIFATDLNDALLEKARHGFYARTLADDISPERLRRFFVQEAGGYRIAKSVREMVVFARHNLVSDPPFSRMDLISCRNLLIYLDPSLQQKTLPTFHYALRPGGFLLLGASESIGRFTDLFDAFDKKHRIFSKKAVATTPAMHVPVRAKPAERGSRPPSAGPPSEEDAAHDLPGELNAQRAADRFMVNRFAPPAVLVDDNRNVLQFRGQTGAYLEVPTGRASFDVLRMAREGLMMPLRAALNQARKQNKTVRREGVRVKRNGEVRAVTLEVVPLSNLRERCYLVLFEDADASRPTDSRSPATPEPPARAGPAGRRDDRRRIADLERELAETREFLQSVQEQQEAANEELQASYEEVQSGNEELQSINEELETSKEELESANEELITVGEEMANRNAELTRLNNDLVNLQTSIRLPIVLLGRDLTIRRFSAQAEKQFDLLATDVGRSVGHLRHHLVLGTDEGESAADLESIVTEVVSTVAEQEHEVRDRAGRWHLLRVRPYVTLDNRVDGAVLTLVNVDELKRSQLALAAARDYAQSTVDTVREPLLVLDGRFRLQSANQSFYRTFGVRAAETVGRSLFELGNGQWDIPRLRELLEHILTEHTAVEDFPVDQEFEHLGRRIMLLNARRIADGDRVHDRILVAIEDITERTRIESGLRESEERYRTLVEQVADYAIFRTDSEGRATTWNVGVKRVLGFDEAEFIGTDIVNTIFTPEDVEQGIPGQELQQATATGKAEHGRWMRRRDGTPFFAAGVTTAIRDQQGRLTGFTKVMRDRTQSVLAEAASHASEVRFRRLFEAAKDGILILDAATETIIDANPFATELLGLSHDDLKGRALPEIGLLPDQPASEAMLRELREKGFVRSGPTQVVARRGSPVDVEIIAYAYREDNRDVFQLHVRDVTERTRLERRTREQAAELVDQHRRKDEFLAMLSHELRNPLAPLANAVRLLRLQDESHSPLEQQAHAIIERQVGQLRHLVDDLLEVSRITTGRIQLKRERIALAGVIERAVETARPAIDLRGHELLVSVPQAPIWVYADAGRLEQVVVNLLANAAKYTGVGGRIWLSVTDEGERSRLSVRDTGIGIAADALPQIFDIFTQSDKALDRAEGGLGIGLSLVKQIVELHGGTVEVQSVLGEGSEFIVYLPSAPAPEASPPPATAAHRVPGPSRRVLVVDDNVDSANTLAMLLQTEGHEVQAAYDGLSALQAIRDYRPEVVLVDIGLPGINGLDVAKRVREDPSLRNIVLVAVTGYGRKVDRRRSREAGFDHHLVKPAELEKLREILAMPLPAP